MLCFDFYAPNRSKQNPKFNQLGQQTDLILHHHTLQLSSKYRKMIAVIGLLLGFLVSALFLIQGKRSRSNDNQEKKRSSHEPVEVRPKSYSKSEVAVHNKRNDCWVIIKDRVYDVTSYVEEHPGGDAILDHAGDDSTDGFFGPQHATRVFDMIEDFYIGELLK